MSEKCVSARGIWHSYAHAGMPGALPHETADLRGVSLSVDEGSLVAVVGANGGGKTTLARHLNALLGLQEGELAVAGIDAADAASTWELRRRVGMVFQNPENQFVSSVVGEDVAFGPLNFGATPTEAERRAEGALAAVGLAGFARRDVHELSGGQQQRVALAGVLASGPRVIVLDEATSMLDGASRDEVLAAVASVRRETGATVLMLTHDMELAAGADAVVVMAAGEVVTAGDPSQVLSDEKVLGRAGLVAPFAVRVWHELAACGAVGDAGGAACPVTIESLVSALCD